MEFDLSFYKRKKVLLTGHTGFKGSWMSVMLVNAGAVLILPTLTAAKFLPVLIVSICFIVFTLFKMLLICFDAAKVRRKNNLCKKALFGGIVTKK